jgi:type IV secretion system protein VirD4
MDKKQKLYLAVFIVGMSAGLIGATQFVGWAYEYNPLLGWSIIRLPGFTFYLPLAFLIWSCTLYKTGQNVINDAGLILIGCLLAPFLLAVIMTRKGRVVKEFGKEAWGNVEDAKAAGIYVKQPAGTIIGFWGDRKQLLSYIGPEHQLVAGASRAGKGAGHVIPTLLNWPESVVVYDPKAECYDITAEWRSKFSHAFYLNFTRRDSVSFNPLSEVRRGDTELADVQNIVQILYDPSGTKEEPNFFDTVAMTLLASVILHQLYTAPDAEKNLAAVRMRLMNLPALIAEMTTTAHRHRRDFTKPDGLARDEKGELIPEAIPEIRNTGLLFAGMAERLQSDLSTTAFSYLNVFSDPIVAEKTSRSDFTFGDLVCGKHPLSCYIQTPPSDAYRLRPLTRLFLSQMAKSLMTDPGRDAAGRKKNHKLLFLIDEFPSLGKLGFFSDNLRVMAGYGIKAMLIVQSFKDIVAAYGPANTIVDNCHITVAFAAADDDSCQKISHMAGRAVEYREALSQSRRAVGFTSGSDSRSYSEQQRNILEPGEVRSLPYDEQLIFVTGSKPYRTKKIRYWEEAPFDGRATNIRKGGYGPDQAEAADLPEEQVTRNPWVGVRGIGTVTSSGLPEAAEPRQGIARDRTPLTNEDDVLYAAGDLGIDLSCFDMDKEP